MQQREPGTGGRSGLASQRSVGALDVMVLRDRRSRDRDVEDPDGSSGRGVLEILESWARLVREQRALTNPTVDLAYVRAARPAGPVCDPQQPACGHHTCETWTMRGTVLAPITVLSERRVLAAHLDWILTQDWVDELYVDIRDAWSQIRAHTGPTGRPGFVAHCPCGGRIRWADGAATCTACGTVTTGLDVVRRFAPGDAA